MSYLAALARAYDRVMEGDVEIEEERGAFVPIGFLTLNTQLEVVLTTAGECVSARWLIRTKAKSDQAAVDEWPTMIPVTEDSSSRTSKPVPHPFHDGLRYVAGDLEQFLDAQNLHAQFFMPYLEQLGAWHAAEPQNAYVDALYRYLSKECLTRDLIEKGILEVGEDGKLTDKKVEGIEQSKAVVRFCFLDADGHVRRPWEDRGFMEDFARYSTKKMETGSVLGRCYVSGDLQLIAEKHGKGIRFSGDNPKLISSNAQQNDFVYSGRFSAAAEAAQVGYLTSEKAHAFLRWLIRNRGYQQEGFVTVVWTESAQKLPHALADSRAFSQELEAYFGISMTAEDFGYAFAQKFRGALSGKNRLRDTPERVHLLSLDATGKGRLAVVSYAAYDLSEYLDNLAYWHETAAWRRWMYDGDTLKETVGVYTPAEILAHAFGTPNGAYMALEGKLMSFQMRRLLPCIADRRRVPTDLVYGLYRRAVRPQTMTPNMWRKTVSMACGMIRKYYLERKEMDYTMQLDKTLRDPSYLFGRLLAAADALESEALRKKDVIRREVKAPESAGYQETTDIHATTANRYMEAYARRPAATWKIIYQRLQPYMRALSAGRRTDYDRLIQEIMEGFDAKTFEQQRALSPLFLLGFEHQKSAIYAKKETLTTEEDME